MFRQFYNFEKLNEQFINCGFDNNDITMLFIHKQVSYYFDNYPEQIERACKVIYDYYTDYDYVDIRRATRVLSVLYVMNIFTFLEDENEIIQLLDDNMKLRSIK